MSSRPLPSTVLDLIKRFSPYLGRVRRMALVTAGVALVSPLISASMLWASKLLIDDVFIGGRMDLLPSFAAAYIIILALGFAVGYMVQRLDAAVVAQIVQNIRVDLYRHMVTVSPGSFGKRGVGDLLAHLTGDVDRTEYLIYSGLLEVFSDLVGALFFVGFLLLLSWKLTLSALVAIPLLVLANMGDAPRLRRAARIARRQATGWLAHAEERLGAVTIVHAFAAQSFETQAFAKRCAKARAAELRTVAIQARLGVLIEAGSALGGMIVLGMGAYEIHAGNLTMGALVTFLGSVGSLYGPVRGLAKAAGRFQRAAAGGQRVADLLGSPSLLCESPGAKPLTHMRGSIEFRDVSFAYPDGSQVLSNVSFKIEPGETVAVVGPSGSGKSTLMRLAMRLCDPSSGTILLDGQDVREVALESLRKAIVPVFQEPYIFRGSVAENIRYGMSATPPARVVESANAAYAASFIGALRGGYEAPVGPRGSLLSGGQRQRLALARAFLRNAPVLLLDEATASLDSETEELIQDAIERFSGTRTTLVVAHRLSSVRRADRVLVLDHGHIIESGAPRALLRTESRCRELFAAQLTHWRQAA